MEMQNRGRSWQAFGFAFISILMYGTVLLAKWTVIDNRSQYVKTFFGIEAGIVLISVLTSYPVSALVQKLWDAGASFGTCCDEGNSDSSGDMWKIPLTKCLRPAGLIMLAWIPYFFFRFPGNVDMDTYWQLMQIYGFTSLSDHHPFFDTLVFGLFWKMGDLLGSNAFSVFIYSLLQMFVTALVFGYAALYCEKRGVPERIGKGMLFFFAFYPVVPLFAQTMAKDMLHAWVYVLFIIFYYELLRTKGAVLSEPQYAFRAAALLLLMMLTKKTGIYIVMISGLGVLWLLRNKKRWLITLLIPVLIFKGLWTGLFFSAFNIYKGSATAMLCVPAQQIAYIVKTDRDSLTPEEWGTLNGLFIHPEELGDIYVPVRGDNTNARWTAHGDRKTKIEFVKWYVRQYFERPEQMFLSTAALDYPLFCVDPHTLGKESLIFNLDGLSKYALGGQGLEKMFAGFSERGATEEDIRNMIAGSYRPKWAAAVTEAFDYCYLHIMEAAAVLFSKVLFGFWIPLYVFFYRLYRGRNQVFMSIPDILNIMILIVGPVVLPRYMVQNIYVAPLLVASMFFSEAEVNQSEYSRLVT